MEIINKSTGEVLTCTCNQTDFTIINHLDWDERFVECKNCREVKEIPRDWAILEVNTND